MENNLNNENAVGILNEIMSEVQNSFLNTNIGQAINTGLDVGIRAILPDFLEDQIINLKDNIINSGFKEGVSQAVTDAINLGKSALGIITGNFESISQAQSAIKSGGIIDNISDLLDSALDGLKSSGVIDSSLAKNIKKQKNTILNNVEKNIEKNFSNQLEDIEKLEKYISNWKDYFKKENFNGMEKEFNKMNKTIQSLLPLENTIKEFRTIENLQELIKNNGKDFNLTDDQLELAKKLF